MGRHRKPGRPKGSKNKPGHKAGRPRKDLIGAISRARSLDEGEFRRLRGRPRKNPSPYPIKVNYTSTNAEVLLGMVKSLPKEDQLKFLKKLLFK